MLRYILILISLPVMASSQDSLRMLIRESQNPFEKIRMLLQLSSHFEKVSQDSAMAVLEETYPFLPEDENLAGQVYYQQGYLMYKAGYSEKARP